MYKRYCDAIRMQEEEEEEEGEEEEVYPRTRPIPRYYQARFCNLDEPTGV